jgi:hypothetical protein
MGVCCVHQEAHTSLHLSQAMSDTERLHLAQRMSALLQRELGESIDSKRMVAQPLYARDVLLVCQALRETELPELAQRFQGSAAGLEPPPPVAPPPAGVPAPDSLSSDLGDSTPSGWVASLWPSTMRGGLFGRGKKQRDSKNSKLPRN